MFKDLMQAKAKANINQEKKAEDYDKILNEAVSLYNRALQEENDGLLKKAAEKFCESLALKRSQMEPYLFLAVIYFMFEEKETAKQYFAAASDLIADKPEFAEFFSQVKQVLYGS
jgi:hypothetical protein